MRYDVKKFLFVGLEQQRAAFFKKAQELGIIHFIPPEKKQGKEVPGTIQDYLAAIKVLRGLPTLPQEELEETDLADGLVPKILDLKQTIDKMAEEERVNRLDIARVQIFGDFSLKDKEEIEAATGRHVQFFCTKAGFEDTHPLPEQFIYIGTEFGLDYYVALNKENVQIPKMLEIQIPHPLGELQHKRKEIQTTAHNAEQKLKTYAKYNTFLHHALIQKLNYYHLNEAKEDVQKEIGNTLFAVTGWVPVNKVDQLQQLLADGSVHAEEIVIEDTDAIPTCLENEGFARLGEDLVHIYDTPSHTDKDPSLWVLVSFAFFFAFIVGDAGYGLIFLGIALYIRMKYSLTSGGKRFVKLFAILGGATLIWGVLTTSFFGIPIGQNSVLRKFSLIQWMAEKKADYVIQHKDQEWKYWVKKYPGLENATTGKEFLEKGATTTEGKTTYDIYNSFSDNLMFELALMIGVVHLMISLLRYANRNWSSIGWIIFLIGAYLYFPVFLKATSIIHFIFGVDPQTGARDGFYLMFAGIGIATLIAIFKNKLLGALEAMNVIQIFADTMSYLRLYALALSGAMLTGTMLDLASSMGFIAGGLLIAAGHLVNIVLSIMGGTIHGLRLNFLEWYHYSFEGGGKVFNPLRKLKID